MWQCPKLDLQWGIFEGVCQGLPLPSFLITATRFQFTEHFSFLLLQQFLLAMVSSHTNKTIQAHLTFSGIHTTHRKYSCHIEWLWRLLSCSDLSQSVSIQILSPTELYESSILWQSKHLMEKCLPSFIIPINRNGFLYAPSMWTTSWKQPLSTNTAYSQKSPPFLIFFFVLRVDLIPVLILVEL